MKAILIDEERNLVWSEVPEPVCKPGEIAIAVQAAAINRADLMQRAGNYPPPPGWPEWPGLEVAGTVAEAPDSGRWHVGDRVCALLGGGGYAERVTVPAEMVLPVPEGIGWTEAAAIPEVWATAYLNLVMEAGMRAGDRVLIQAGASGLGLAAIQLAHQYGARVVTTVGSEEKAAFVKTLGVEKIVQRKTQDLGAVLEALPVDIVLDCVGGARMGAHLAKLAPEGRWIQIAALAGPRTELDLATLYRKRLRIIGSTLRARTSAKKAEILQALESELWPRFSSGEIRSILYKTLPIASANEAQAILERNENIGKVVLTVP